MLIAASSFVFSCVVMGISISLLLSERSNTYMAVIPASKWRQEGPNSPNPNPNLTPRDPDGPYFADGDDYHVSEILAIVSSALNWLVATAL